MMARFADHLELVPEISYIGARTRHRIVLVEGAERFIELPRVLKRAGDEVFHSLGKGYEVCVESQQPRRAHRR